MLRIAVISDLHIGANGRFRDTIVPKSDRYQIDVNLSEEFNSFAKSNDLKADFLVVPGDLSEYGKHNECVCAKKLVENIAASLCVTKECIVGCPGNHDKDWKVLESWDGYDVETNLLSYKGLTDCSSIISGTPLLAMGDVLGQDRWAVTLFEKAIFLLYNSTWKNQRHSKDNNRSADWGYYFPKDTEGILSAIDKLRNEAQSSIPTIVVLHHHPMVVDEPNYQPDYSTLVNAEAFREMCADIKADMIIHGHKHQSRITTYNLDSRREVPILCAGSFCKKMEPYLQGSALNQFYIVEIEKRNLSTDALQGKILSWSYTPVSGWIRSKKAFAGIDAVSFFGCNLGEFELIQIIRERVKEARKKDNRGLHWSEICVQDNNIEFVSPHVARKALHELRRNKEILQFDDNGKGGFTLVLPSKGE